MCCHLIAITNNSINHIGYKLYNSDSNDEDISDHIEIILK